MKIMANTIKQMYLQKICIIQISKQVEMYFDINNVISTLPVFTPEMTIGLSSVRPPVWQSVYPLNIGIHW